MSVTKVLKVRHYPSSIALPSSTPFWSHTVVKLTKQLYSKIKHLKQQFAWPSLTSLLMTILFIKEELDHIPGY